MRQHKDLRLPWLILFQGAAMLSNEVMSLYWLVCSFIENSLSTFYMQGTELDTKDREMNNIYKCQLSLSLHLVWERSIN